MTQTRIPPRQEIMKDVSAGMRATSVERLAQGYMPQVACMVSAPGPQYTRPGRTGDFSR